MKLILVGNGKQHSKNGKIIDSFDKVVRFNDFKIKGYEDYVGYRTDIVVGVKKKDLSIYDNVELIFIPTLIRNHVFDKKIQHKIKYIDIDLLNDILQEYKFPTSGYRAVLHFLSIGYDVTIIGFDGLKSGHYFDNDQMWDKHDGDYEMNEFRKLEAENKLTIID